MCSLSYNIWLAHMSMFFKNLVTLVQIALLVIGSCEVNYVHCLDYKQARDNDFVLCAVTSGPLCSETYPSVPFGYVDSTGAKVNPTNSACCS